MLFRIGRQKVKVKVSYTLKTNVLNQENKTLFFFQRTVFSCFVLFWLFCLFIYDVNVILAVWHDLVFICSDYWNSWYCGNGVDFHFNVIKPLLVLQLQQYIILVVDLVYSIYFWKHMSDKKKLWYDKPRQVSVPERSDITVILYEMSLYVWILQY